MKKPEIISRMLAFDKFLLGMDYSNTYRYLPYKEGSADCSSLQAMAMSFAGYPLLDDSGKSLVTSCYEVYAKGYDLIYPESESLIGKKLPSASNLCTTYGAQPGDLVFFNFDSDTSRANKITHIAAVLDSEHYIHTANNKEKCCIVPITWGRSRICAILRLKDNVESISLTTLKKGVNSSLRTKMLQANLNYKIGSKLEWDGSFGSDTETALKKFQTSVGLEANGICDDTVWNKLLGVAETKPVDPPPVTPPPVVEKWTLSRMLKLQDPAMTGDDVKHVQSAVIKAGFSVGSTGADGEFGPKTEAGVKSFQTAKKLTVDGVVGPKTCVALGGTWVEAKPPAPTYAFQLIRQLEKDVPDGNDIKAVQQRLLALGYKLPKYGADGDFGSETEAAVKAFQTAKKLEVDGVIGPKTCAALGGQWLGK